jgi:hypothetical protein
MATTMTFAKVQSYLNAILRAPDPQGDIGNSPHGTFWNSMSYSEFITGNVPGGQRTECNGRPTPIIDQKNPEQSPLYVILTDRNGFCAMPKMPEFGPFIDDPGYATTLPDGTPITGDEIRQGILEWLTNGFPE